MFWLVGAYERHDRTLAMVLGIFKSEFKASELLIKVNHDLADTLDTLYFDTIPIHTDIFDGTHHEGEDK